MDKKSNKKGKTKKQATSHGRTGVKKQVPEVTKEKEEQERLEAANILSSLKFMAPSSNETNSDDPQPTNDSKKTSRPVTQFPNSTTGISTIAAPSIGSTKGGQPVTSGSMATLLPPAVIAQLAQMTSSNQQIRQETAQELFQKLLAMQANTVNKIPTKSQPVPTIVKTLETTRLPTTLNPIKTVNRSVATALRHVVAQNTKINPNNEVIKSIKEKIQKKNPDGEVSSIDFSEKSTNDQNESADKKKDTTETSLPLKKRRLVSLLGSSSSEITSNRISDLSTAVQMDNILNLARDYPDQKGNSNDRMSISSTSTTVQSEGYRPVSFDPRTSLLVLSDLKTALTPDEDGDLPIHIAVVHENTELVKKFIDIMAMSGKSVDRYNKLQQTPLHLAVLVNKPDIVQALLLANADPNLVDRNGCTSAHIAVTKQFKQCLKQIFVDSRKRVEVNTRNYEGYSPLHTSVEIGDLKAMKFLNERGAPTYINLNIQDGKAGRSVLFYATEYKQVKMVEYLVSCGANVDLQNYAGVTAIMTAQAGGYDDISHLLTRALENQKGIEDAIVQKNVPIAPMPTKMKLMIPDSPAIRSRSSSFDVKPASRRSSTSSSSPMDLSLQRRVHSPGQASGRRSHRNSVDSELSERLAMSELEKASSNSKRLKEKHSQLVAALEDKQRLTSSQKSYIEGFLSVVEKFKDKEKANFDLAKMKNVLQENRNNLAFLESSDMTNCSDPEHQIKQEPMDIDEQQSEVREDDEVECHNEYPGMEITTNSARIPDKIVPIDSNNYTATRADSGQAHAPELHEVDVDKEMSTATEMEVQDSPSMLVEIENSPSMPVLSRAVSLTEKTSESVTEQENCDSTNTSPIIEEVSNKLDVEKGNLGTNIGDQTSLTGDVLKNRAVIDNEVNSNETINKQNKGTNITNEGTPRVERKSCDSEMDINAIEMDAEEDESDGGLVIDENSAMETTVAADKTRLIGATIDQNRAMETTVVADKTRLIGATIDENKVIETTVAADKTRLIGVAIDENIAMKTTVAADKTRFKEAANGDNAIETTIVADKGRLLEAASGDSVMNNSSQSNIETGDRVETTSDSGIKNGKGDSVCVNNGETNSDSRQYVGINQSKQSNTEPGSDQAKMESDSNHVTTVESEQAVDKTNLQANTMESEQTTDKPNNFQTGTSIPSNTSDKTSSSSTHIHKPPITNTDKSHDLKQAGLGSLNLEKQPGLASLNLEKHAGLGSLNLGSQAGLGSLNLEKQVALGSLNLEKQVALGSLNLEKQVALGSLNLEKQVALGSLNLEKQVALGSLNLEKQVALGSLNLEKMQPAENLKSDTASLPSGQTKTVYIREGENYKPIKIFVDGSPQSSLVLQRMLGQAPGVSNRNTASLSFVTSDNQPPVDRNKVTMTRSISVSGNSSNIASTGQNVNAITANQLLERIHERKNSNQASVRSENSPKQDSVNKDINNSISSKTELLVKSAKLESLKQELKSRISFQDSLSQCLSLNHDEIMTSKLKQTLVNQSSMNASHTPNHVPGSKTVTEKVTKITDKTDKKSIESINYDKISSDHLTEPKVQSKPTHSSLIDSNSINTSQKQLASQINTSQKQLASQLNSSGSSKTGLGVSVSVTSQSKVASLIQSRNAVSTSEGTLTWVNPDIKSRLSKALQSPQRKLGAKTVSQEGETTPNATTGISNHQNVQVVGTNSS